MSKLLIVESPAKAKTIKKYLGKDFSVVASMGHLRDLPKSSLSVDIENGFKPKYITVRGKGDIVKNLKKLAKKKEEVLLATDPDREGEAISWHLAHLLNLDINKANRVTFNEITRHGIKLGMKNLRKIDLDLVNAQQARRIVDRLVGYTLSPFLSSKIRWGLSAGRVQSVAVRIIVNREKEIRKFVSEEYYTIDAEFSPKNKRKSFKASFYGDKNGKIKLQGREQAENIIKELKNAKFFVSDIKYSKRQLSPLPPFITSTMQQEASKRLNFPAKKTMLIAQQLYEGVNVIKRGTVGLITYMRTDSIRVSDDALKVARKYLLNVFGEKYIPDKPRIFKTKSNAQDAHEAIRPTMPELTPDELEASLSKDQFKLYNLIWSRFMASQMSNCIHDTTKIDVMGKDYIFKSSGYTVSFDGFTKLYLDIADKGKKSKDLPKLEKNELLNLKQILANQHFTEPPPRFTEATLIKTLEEDGIGRPSTYASTISTILSRQYIQKEKKVLKPTELGEVTNALMEENFPDIVNVKFTANMENNLDQIEEGKKDWVKTVEDFYKDFDRSVQKAKKEMENVKIQLEEDQTDIVCDMCGKKMVVKMGRYGKFLGCSGYPECKNIKKMVQETGAKCPKCGGNIVYRKSKKGRTFYGCDNYPDCNFVSWDPPALELCPKCNKTLFQKKGSKNQIYCKSENCDYTEYLNKGENKQ